MITFDSLLQRQAVQRALFAGGEVEFRYLTSTGITDWQRIIRPDLAIFSWKLWDEHFEWRKVRND